VKEKVMPSARLRPIALVCCVAAVVAGCAPVSAALHDPHTLPALAGNPHVHFDDCAEEYARAVAKILPRLIAKIAAAHGRPFARDFVVAAYLNDAAYAAANGRGDANTRGVAFLGRVTLSPHIWRESPSELEPYLAHELLHEHLFSHLSVLDYLRIPIWFTERIAVMASDGGGAQRASVQAAQRAISEGHILQTPDEAALFGNVSLKAPAPGAADEDMRLRMHMAYRQAGLFVAFLRERYPAAFKALPDRPLCRRELQDGLRSRLWFERRGKLVALRAEVRTQLMKTATFRRRT
jgi:hypothetical protein